MARKILSLPKKLDQTPSEQPFVSDAAELPDVDQQAVVPIMPLDEAHDAWTHFGTSWANIKVGAEIYRLASFCPFEFSLPLDGDPIDIRVAFGHHVFADEKRRGPPFTYAGDRRFLSKLRIERNNALPAMMPRIFQNEFSRACRNKKSEKQFFMKLEGDWAVFYDLRLNDLVRRRFTMKVISAYTIDKSSQTSVPGRQFHLYSNVDILRKLLNGNEINHDAKKRS